MLEKLTSKLCNILLSIENFEMTILPPSFPREADRYIATMIATEANTIFKTN